MRTSGEGGGLTGTPHPPKKLEFIRMYIWKSSKIPIPVCLRKKILIHACSIAFRFFVNVVLYKTEAF